MAEKQFNKTYRNALYNKAYIRYGTTMQYIVACEEMAELIKELSKSIRGTGSMSGVIEEAADVSIVLEELIWYLGIEGEVEKVRLAKLRRLEERLSNDTNLMDQT